VSISTRESERCKTLNQDYNFYLTLDRFVMTPRPAMMKELGAKDKEISDDISSLDKKVSKEIHNYVLFPVHYSHSIRRNTLRSSSMKHKANYETSY
jgi:hypothetical protein